MAAINCDLTDVPASTGFDAIPAGEYKAVITASEEKPTKKNDGHYLQLTFEIIEGPYEKRKLWARLNLDNPNDQAVGIARSELKAICLAVGVPAPKDSVQLHDLPLLIKVGFQKKQNPQDPTEEPRNEIKGYKPLTPGGAAKVNGGTIKTGAGSAPWKK